MESKERREKAKVELRTKILDAARNLFAERGLDAVTMRQIASAIGYTATAIYYHFPSKESLLLELCNADFRALANHLKHLGAISDPVERIQKLGVGYINYGLEFPQSYRFMFMTPRMEPAPTELDIEQGNPDQDGYALLRQSVQEAIEAGRFRPELKDAELLAQAFWAAVHGLVALYLTKAETKWIEWRPVSQTAELLTASVLQGMLKH